VGTLSHSQSSQNVRPFPGANNSHLPHDVFRTIGSACYVLLSGHSFGPAAHVEDHIAILPGCRLSGGHRRSALRRMSTASSIHHFRRGPPKPSFYASFKSPSFSEETSLRVCESGRDAAAPVGRSLAASRATTLRAARQMGTYFWAKQFQMSTHVDPFRTKFCVQM